MPRHDRDRVWWWFAAADPALNRLRVATRGALSIALALFAEWVFVGTTGALERPLPSHATSAALATIDAQHHDMLVVALLLGGLVAMLSGFNGNEPTFGGQLITTGYIAATVAASLALGLAIGTDRSMALVVMVLLLVVGAYGRRFGQRGAITGVILFIGYFYGFFLSSALGVGSAGWLAGEVFLGAAASVVVRIIFFRPSAALDLRLGVRTYKARVRKVLLVAHDVFEERTERRHKLLQRWIVRLDEAALIVDGQLARRGTVGVDVALMLHRWVFDMEVSVTNVARLADALGPENDRGSDPVAQMRRVLGALIAGDTDAVRDAAGALRASLRADEESVRLRRFAGAAIEAAGAMDRASVVSDVVRRHADDRTPPIDDRSTFSPAVSLLGGWLPGSAEVSAEAASLPNARVRLAPYLRTTAQMAVAVGVSIVAGDALDSQRFYWAVIAAVLVLVGTNTLGEQLRKAAFRVVGTLAGIVVGTALVALVGHHSVWSLVVVVGVMWIGMYYFRVNYALMAMAVTISLSQVYLSLGEFSNGLLWERLAETSLGAGAAMLTVLVVVPLRTRAVVDVALAGVVDAVASLADASAAVLSAETDAADLRALGRNVDAAYQALVATAMPLRLVAWTDSADRLDRQLASASAARNYARNLVVDVPIDGELSPGTARYVSAAKTVLAQSARSLAAHLREEMDQATYMYSASLFGAAEDHPAAADGPAGADDPGADRSIRSESERPTHNLALRDLVLLDEALGALALASGVPTVSPSPDVLVSITSGAIGPGTPRQAQVHSPGDREARTAPSSAPTPG